jgi:hypothetical protein
MTAITGNTGKRCRLRITVDGLVFVAYADRGDTFPPSMEARYLWRDAVLGVRAELQAAPLTLNIHHLNEQINET